MQKQPSTRYSLHLVQFLISRGLPRLCKTHVTTQSVHAAGHTLCTPMCVHTYTHTLFFHIPSRLIKLPLFIVFKSPLIPNDLNA